MPRRGSPYGPAHERFKRELARRPRPCWLRLVCDGAFATEPDHDPPLSRHQHVEGSGCCVLRGACGPCQRRQAVDLANETRRAGKLDLGGVELEEVVEPVGFPVGSPVWRVSWLDDLREAMTDEAVWPRLMTVPHPRAVGSLGVEFEWWCRAHRGIDLRWWQRLVARRLLEVDADGRLVWMVLILTLARQLGKSWLLRMLLAWRLHQGDRFGGPQRLLHMSIQMSQVIDVMEPEIARAEGMPAHYATLNNNNATEIERLLDGSKWVRIVKGTARSGGAYGQSGVSVGCVDEAWSIAPSVVDDGLEPTIVEAFDPWLMLVSTAHRRATALMLDRRAGALDALDTGDDALIIEWSTPRHFELDDVEGWRMASPHWTRQREQLIRGAVRRALSGQASDDPDEPDPVESVRAQWLNVWPSKLSRVSRGEPLLDVDRWDELTVDGSPPLRLWVAVEENIGRGAGVVAVAEIDGGRFELDAWTCADRDEAFTSAQATLEQWCDVPSMFLVGPSLDGQAPGAEKAVPAEVRFGLPLLRELVESGRAVHDSTPELDRQLREVRVKPAANGLAVVSGERSDLVRAAAIAVRAAVVEAPLPAIHRAGR